MINEEFSYCSEPIGKDEWAKGLTVSLTRYDQESLLGDICRVTTGGNFCPTGCVETKEPSFCNNINTDTPCRTIQVETETSLDISNTQQPSDPCVHVKVPGWAVGQPVRLERHSEESSHGDVCRTSENFFCPKGCRQMESAPFCSEFGSRTSCRVEGDTGE